MDSVKYFSVEVVFDNYSVTKYGWQCYLKRCGNFSNLIDLQAKKTGFADLV